MTLIERVDRHIDAIRQLGARAIEDAKRDGVPAVYVDPSLGPWIVREMPDGTRERFERRNGEVLILERYGPRPRA